MANWNNPTVTSTYVNYTAEVKDRDLDVAKGMDPATTSVTNPVANMIRWNSANHYWEKYNGAVWSALDSSYAINISGSAGSVAFANVTGKPTTLGGYGITDAQGLDADLTAVAGLSTTGLISRTGAGTAATRSIVAPAAGITVSNGDGVAGNPTLALANDLSAVEALATNGIAVRTATSTWTTRSITQPAAGITVTNGDGVSGNPTLALANDLSALEGLASTGIAVRTGSDAWAQRSVAGTTNRITVSNGDGVAGNPTLDIGSEVATLNTEDQALTGGVVVTSKDLGTISSGTVTPDPGDRPMQHYVNGGAHTLAPSSNVGSTIVQVTNNGSAGAVTTSGFQRVTGDSFSTTNGHEFLCVIVIAPGCTLLDVRAMQ